MAGFCNLIQLCCGLPIKFPLAASNITSFEIHFFFRLRLLISFLKKSFLVPFHFFWHTRSEMERRKATQTKFAFLDFTDFKPISLVDFDFHIHFSQKIFKTEEAEGVARLSFNLNMLTADCSTWLNYSVTTTQMFCFNWQSWD